MIGRVAIAAALALAGCHVPIGVSAPRGAPLGGGLHGVHATLEFPAIDVLATATAEPDPESPEQVEYDNRPRFSAAFSYGITDDIDVEMEIEAHVATVIPWPQAGTLGARVRLYGSRALAVSAAAAAGYGGLLAQYMEEPYSGSSVDVVYGRASVAVEPWPEHWIHPLVSVSATPMYVIPHIEDGPERDPFALWPGAITAGVRLSRWTIFVAGGLVAAPDPRGTSPVVSAGVVGSLWR